MHDETVGSPSKQEARIHTCRQTFLKVRLMQTPLLTDSVKKSICRALRISGHQNGKDLQRAKEILARDHGLVVRRDVAGRLHWEFSCSNRLNGSARLSSPSAIQ